ncbi:hypothetical protein CXB77_00285 [Chromatium okenii]|uniref:Uncharacterized protein n=2 Tax=Chromatium okenii TaxID=61644 RepID=A0A2S7XW57_9GAMM|nr:hypothetical protein CXB77_00285 [Chromatium okenii]
MIAMRDYKTKPQEWPTAKERNPTMRVLVNLISVVVIAAATYFGYQWFSSMPKDNASPIDKNSRIIPLQLPPLKVSPPSPQPSLPINSVNSER